MTIMNMRHIKPLLSLAILLAATAAQTPAQAQVRTWTLKQCIDHALEHNIGVKQRDNERRRQELQLSTARNSRLPDLNASVGQNFSFGRGLTAQNTYTNTNTSSTSFSIGTGIPLFTGMSIPNTIKLNRLNLEAATADLEKAKNDIRMQVAQAYVEILYAMEMADVAHRQIAIDSMQAERLKAMVDNGKASEVELSQQQATLSQSRLTATQADNNIKLALLTLSQLLELPTPENFAVSRPGASGKAESHTALPSPDTSLPSTNATLPSPDAILPSPDAIYAEAAGSRPEIQAEQLRLQGTERNIAIARAALYPQLSLSAGLGTNYYKTSGFRAEPFSDQIKNNFSQYIGLNLSIPIFNRFQTRNNIRSAKISRETQMLQLDNTRKALYKEIQQVYYNATAAAAKYNSSSLAVRSSENAFMLMTAKYENGKAGITEFNEAKNNYLKAESDLTQARYEYLYQTALLDFYRGHELDF